MEIDVDQRIWELANELAPEDVEPEDVQGLAGAMQTAFENWWDTTVTTDDEGGLDDHDISH